MQDNESMTTMEDPAISEIAGTQDGQAIPEYQTVTEDGWPTYAGVSPRQIMAEVDKTPACVQAFVNDLLHRLEVTEKARQESEEEAAELRRELVSVYS